MKPVKLILPGLFLLTLGAGNFGVGSFKSREYQQVLKELSGFESTAVITNASPMRRIQVAKVSADRLSARLSKAQHRRDFYNLVQFGGKCFIALGLIFLLPGLVLILRDRMNSAGRDRNEGDSSRVHPLQNPAPSRPSEAKAA